MAQRTNAQADFIDSMVVRSSNLNSQLDLHAFLKKEKILVGPTRSFEREKGSSRLNLALYVCHMPDHLSRLVETIKC